MADQNQDQNQDRVVELVDAGVPADQGLSSLGLLMQLGGHVFAASAALMAFYMLLALRGSGDTMMVFLLIGLAVTRSIFHLMAGSQLLYGSQQLREDGKRDHTGGIRRYIIFALVQTAITASTLLGKYHSPVKSVAFITAALALWPVTLLILFQLPRFRRYKNELPITEDKGFEGASIMMTVLGLCGVVGGGTYLLVLLDMPGNALSRGPGVFMVLTLGMLVVRSVLHVQAGASGLKETSVDRSVELANRYANFGVISSFCAGGALLMFAMWGGMNIFLMAVICGMCWILMAWPMIVRRYFSDRQFADLLAGDDQMLHRRAPDAGLTGLGWLLFAQAMLVGAQLLFAFAVPDRELRSLAMLSMLGGSALRSIWWSVGVTVLQGWAGYELVRMSRQSRAIATIYGIVGAAVTLYANWPMIKMFSSMKMFGGGGGPELLRVGWVAMSVLLPVVTLVMVNRKIAPTAQARFRSKPAS